MTLMRKIKKQIDKQTRPSVGSVKVRTEASLFADEGAPNWNIGRTTEPPIIIWGKTSYSLSRGTGYVITPEAFNAPFAQTSIQDVPTITGNMKDINSIPYYNARYAGWAGIDGGGTVSITMRTANSSVAIWVDNTEIYNAIIGEFSPVDIEFNVGDKSLIQIFWYSAEANNSFVIVGNLSYQLSTWSTIDSTPYFRTVEWYTEAPIEADSIYLSGVATIFSTLRWWFNIAEESETGDDGDPADGDPPTNDSDLQNAADTDLGGFGIWTIDFQNIGEIDVLSNETILINGYYPNLAYIKLPDPLGEVGTDGDITNSPGTVYKVVNMDSYDQSTNTTVLNIGAHGLTDDDDGRVVLAGLLKHLQDIRYNPYENAITDVFETTDWNLVQGELYYYLVDTFDTSSYKNRGGMTETYQSIVAGDYVAPDIVTNLIAVRNSIDSVTLEWDGASPSLVHHWNVYTDAYSNDYTINGVGVGRLVAISDITDIKNAFLANPTGLLVSIEYDGEKYIRKVSNITAGDYVLLAESIPSTIMSGTMRIMSTIYTVNNGTITTNPPNTGIEPVPIDGIFQLV